MHGPGLEPDWGKTIVDDILGATEEIWIWTGYRVISRNHTVNFVQYDVIFFFWMLFFFKSLLFRDKPKCFGSRIVCICNFKYFNRRNKESWKEKKLTEDENQSRIGTKKFESRNPKGLVKIVPVYS